MNTVSGRIAAGVLALSVLWAAPVLLSSGASSSSAGIAHAAEGAPKEEMQATLDRVVDIATSLRGDSNKSARRAELRKVIAPKFDFREMSMRALGAHWREVTPEQQEDFVSVFSDLLAKTYLERIETVERGMVKIDGDSVDGQKAVVRTSVTSKGETFPIVYKLLDREGTWKVYDVVIENIGLVANYRNEFAGIIRREKFDGLLERLRVKGKA